MRFSSVFVWHSRSIVPMNRSRKVHQTKINDVRFHDRYTPWVPDPSCDTGLLGDVGVLYTVIESSLPVFGCEFRLPEESWSWWCYWNWVQESKNGSTVIGRGNVPTSLLLVSLDMCLNRFHQFFDQSSTRLGTESGDLRSHPFGSQSVVTTVLVFELFRGPLIH